MSTSPNPVLVDVLRGGKVESRHRGALVVVDETGTSVTALGDGDALVFPRSAIKPIQALPLIETGAAERFAVSDAEIALACASHNGAPDHVARVRAWLERMGLGEGDLECGGHDSLHLGETKARAWEHVEPTAAFSNCSGKHTGFLATALHMGEPLTGYIRPDHPVQRRALDAIRTLCDADPAPEGQTCGTDGCGIPACRVGLKSLALGMARMAARQTPAQNRIVNAMMAHPHLIAGDGRSDTALMTALKGRVATKIGAEGVHIAIIPAGVTGSRAMGVALKIDDGAPRAADVAMANVLNGLGLMDDAARAAVAQLLETPLVNTLGETVGAVRPSDALQGVFP